MRVRNSPPSALERADIGLGRLHRIGVAAMRLVHDAGDAFRVDLRQVLRESPAPSDHSLTMPRPFCIATFFFAPSSMSRETTKQ